MNEKRRKKLSKFYIFYAIFCALLIFAISVGAAVFYDFIREYEKCLPEHVADDYIMSLDGEAFAAIVAPELEKRSSGFETADALGKTLAEAVAEGVTYTECVGEDTPTYDVYCGGKLMKLRLSGSPSGKYGFESYVVDSAEIYPEWISDRFSSITVIIPGDASLTLNGIPVGEEYKTGEEFASTSLSAFDGGAAPLVTYEIGDIFGDAEVAAEFRGESLKLTSLGEGSTYYSDYDLASRFDYTVKAPRDAKITANGVSLSASELTSTEKLGGMSTEFEPDTAPELSVYTLRGLLDVPELEVTLDGESLTPSAFDNTHSEYAYPDSYKHFYTARVPKGMKLFCNGFEVGSSYISGESYEYTVPRSAGGGKASEKCDVYRVGLYNEPVFTVSAEGAVSEADGDVFTFYPVPSSSEESEIRNLSQKFTELFVKYATEDGRKAQENYDAFIGYVKSGSDAYDIITVTLSSMLYNSPFTVKKLETKIYDLVKYSDSCISVKVDFSSHAEYYKYEKDANGTYEMVWVKSGGSWKLCGFTM